mmetsp:Transcript_30855/g.94904  ORF Transcript_30855/g.94904 Transcript_30855/m.94904 type:complete len:225 (-) Transcript_30855:10-684(-)
MAPLALCHRAPVHGAAERCCHDHRSQATAALAGRPHRRGTDPPAGGRTEACRRWPTPSPDFGSPTAGTRGRKARGGSASAPGLSVSLARSRRPWKGRGTNDPTDRSPTRASATGVTAVSSPPSTKLSTARGRKGPAPHLSRPGTSTPPSRTSAPQGPRQRRSPPNRILERTRCSRLQPGRVPGDVRAFLVSPAAGPCPQPQAPAEFLRPLPARARALGTLPQSE